MGYCLVILSFQYCPFSTVFSALSFHPHKPQRVHRSTSGWWSCRELIIAVPAFKCRAAAAAALRRRCAAAALLLLLLCCAAAVLCWLRWLLLCCRGAALMIIVIIIIIITSIIITFSL